MNTITKCNRVYSSSGARSVRTHGTMKKRIKPATIVQTRINVITAMSESDGVTPVLESRNASFWTHPKVGVGVRVGVIGTGTGVVAAGEVSAKRSGLADAPHTRSQIILRTFKISASKILRTSGVSRSQFPVYLAAGEL